MSEPKQPEVFALTPDLIERGHSRNGTVRRTPASEAAARMWARVIWMEDRLSEKMEQIAGLQDAVLGLEHQLSEAKAKIAELENDISFIGTHKDMGDCPTFYDGCHCTHETLAHNIQRAEAAEAKLKAIEEIVQDQSCLLSHQSANGDFYWSDDVDALLARICEAIK